MIKYIFMLVLVLISSLVFSQNFPATTGNRIYADYGEFTHDYTDATALDKDPPNNDPLAADTILSASSLTIAQNFNTGVHSWTAKSWINCYNAQYKGTWVLQHHTPHIVLLLPISRIGQTKARHVLVGGVSNPYIFQQTGHKN